MSKFPKNFVWGAASSAYQIEGDPLADGGGKSVWDTFSHTPGKTFEGNTGDTACRSYAHPEWDIENLKHMGLSAYRFSTSWARIDPQGDGNWNEKGLAYYDRLVDLCEVLFIGSGDNDGFYAVAQSSHRLFLEPADGKNSAAN